MQNIHSITITVTDYQQILSLVQNHQSELSLMLEDELNRAQIIQDNQLPADVVGMNSQVYFLDQETGKESVVTLVYPQDANIHENKISILTPVGAALIGLRTGQIIQWPFPNGKDKKIQVLAVHKN